MGYNPSYKWINPTYPIYNWGYNPLTKWDEPPSNMVKKTHHSAEASVSIRVKIRVQTIFAELLVPGPLTDPKRSGRSAGFGNGKNSWLLVQNPEDPCMEYLPTLTPKVI